MTSHFMAYSPQLYFKKVKGFTQQDEKKCLANKLSQLSSSLYNQNDAESKQQRKINFHSKMDQCKIQSKDAKFLNECRNSILTLKEECENQYEKHQKLEKDNKRKNLLIQGYVHQKNSLLQQKQKLVAQNQRLTKALSQIQHQALLVKQQNKSLQAIVSQQNKLLQVFNYEVSVKQQQQRPLKSLEKMTQTQFRPNQGTIYKQYSNKSRKLQRNNVSTVFPEKEYCYQVSQKYNLQGKLKQLNKHQIQLKDKQINQLTVEYNQLCQKYNQNISKMSDLYNKLTEARNRSKYSYIEPVEFKNNFHFSYSNEYSLQIVSQKYLTHKYQQMAQLDNKAIRFETPLKELNRQIFTKQTQPTLQKTCKADKNISQQIQCQKFVAIKQSNFDIENFQSKLSNSQSKLSKPIMNETKIKFAKLDVYLNRMIELSSNDTQQI